MWEVLNKSDPYPKLTPHEVAIQVATKALQLPKSGEFPDLEEIMHKCNEFEASARPTFKDICDMFDKINS